MNKNIVSTANQPRSYTTDTIVNTVNDIYALVAEKPSCGKTESQNTHDALHYFTTGLLTV